MSGRGMTSRMRIGDKTTRTHEHSQKGVPYICLYQSIRCSAAPPGNYLRCSQRSAAYNSVRLPGNTTNSAHSLIMRLRIKKSLLNEKGHRPRLVCCGIFVMHHGLPAAHQ